MGPLAEAVVVVERSNGGEWGLKCRVLGLFVKKGVGGGVGGSKTRKKGRF